MSSWITSSGLLANLDRGELANISLQYQTTYPLIKYSVISGELPNGLTLSAPGNNQTLPYPSIYGIVPTNENSKEYSFTIRAISNVGIDDRTFSLIVNDDETGNIFPNSNLGIFPDGFWMFANVAPISLFNGNISIISGVLPGNLSIDSIGMISGYINPNNLYTTPTANGYNSANTKSFSFMVGYDANITSNYSMTVMRADLYANSNANVLRPVYHAPIFIDANFYQNPNSANINLGNICGDSIYYQFITEDFENDLVKYQLINGNAIPGNVSLNSNTGWLTGYINLNDDLVLPYTFDIRAYKSITEPLSGPNINPYQTIMPVTFTIQSPLEKSIQWKTQTQLSNITAGIPSTLRINAEIIDPFIIPPTINPTASATLKLVGAEIVNGGNNFSIGEYLNIPGGKFTYPANIIISGVNSGVITNIIIKSGVQEYTELPILNNIAWENSNGYNALFNLDFGVDNINIINSGRFCDSATIGFSYTGETVQAQANAIIFNNSISKAIVTLTGNNYQEIPEVTINGSTVIKPTNPISYNLSNGTLPLGLEFLSNGLIVGLANAYSSSNIYNFAVTASIGTNKEINYTEPDIPGPGNVVIEDFQTLVQSTQNFSLIVNNSESIVPQTNLSLEFLLSDNDYNTLFSPISNQSIISNLDIYRDGDFYFGKQQTMRMLIAYGIPPVLPENVIVTIAKYHHNKTFLLNNLKWARSTTDNYEVIYIQPIDEFTDINGATYQGNIYPAIFAPEITVDSNLYMADSYIYKVSNNNQLELYPATLPNMMNQIAETLGAVDNNFLPTWMRDVQPDNNVIGFIPAIPLVYVNPGCGKRILFYLQKYYNSTGPALNTIKAETDRYIWNYGYINENNFLYPDENSIYLKFKNSTFVNQSIISV